MPFHRLTLALLFLGALPVVPGCGDTHPGIVPVSGTVTIDGAPVTAGLVKVSAAGHRPSVGMIDENGRFTLSCFEIGDGAPTGVHPVTVTAIEQVSESSNRWHAPKKYASEVESGLTANIDGPTDDLKIELTWARSNQNAPFVDKF